MFGAHLHWQADPSVWLGVVAAAIAYGWLYRRGADDRRRAPWPWWKVVSFAGSLLVILVALVTPLDDLADTYFFAHMLQHMLLLVITPPLLILGLPMRAMLRALPPAVRRGIIRPLARSRVRHAAGCALLHPATVFALFNGVIIFWHVPAMFRVAQEDGPLHVLEHVSFLAAGCLLWWVIVEPVRVWPKDAALTKIAFIVLSHLPMLLLGQLLLAFTSIPLYALPGAIAGPAALGALTDQRIGGGIMVGLDMAVTFTTVSVLFGRYLARLERRQLDIDAAQAARADQALRRSRGLS